MQCFTCGTETSNPKFCSRSCAAKTTNRTNPKRMPQHHCTSCGTSVSSQYRKCLTCRSIKADPVLSKSVNSNQGNSPAVREQARKLYIASGRPMSCLLCGYSLHVDVCHVKDIRDHDDGTPFSVINQEANLIALCKNHHWEFDHDVL